MPIEIKELHIKVVVANNPVTVPHGFKTEDITKLKKELSNEILDKVLRLLKQKNER